MHSAILLLVLVLVLEPLLDCGSCTITYSSMQTSLRL